jgi:hypothetical protein
MWKKFIFYIQILEDCLLPREIYMYKYITESRLLWTVFMFQVTQQNTCNAYHEVSPVFS